MKGCTICQRPRLLSSKYVMSDTVYNMHSTQHSVQVSSIRSWSSYVCMLTCFHGSMATTR